MPATWADRNMKLDGLLKIPDIPGASRRSGHEEEIEIHGLEFTMQAPHDSNTLSRRGRVNLSPMSIVKYYDMSSPYIQRALFENKMLGDVVLTARRTIDNEDSDYLVITMTDASVMAYNMLASEESPDLIEERIDFAFTKIEFNYDDQHTIDMDVGVGR